MASSMTLALLRSKTLDFLFDTAGAIWVNAQLDQGGRLAIGEYSLALPVIVATTFTPTADTREIDISSLTALWNVHEVWFPYTAASPEYPPERVLFRVFDVGGKPYLYLDIDDLADGVDVARVFYTKAHTLKDLDSATVTTWPAVDDGLIIIGTAAHVLMSRAVDLAETTGVSAVSTPNLAAMASRYIKEFRKQLLKRQRLSS